MFRRSTICVTIVTALFGFGAQAVDFGSRSFWQFPSPGLGWGGADLFAKLHGFENPAVNFPYFWAWHLFTDINRPSRIRKIGGGWAVKWESWASDTETFPTCPNPLVPPVWPGETDRDKVLSGRAQTAIADEGTVDLDWYTLVDGKPSPVQVSDPQEVRRNEASFDYIVDNDLYYTEGLEAAFAEAQDAVDAAGGGTAQSTTAVLDTVEFPTDAIEMKADWVPLSAIPEDQQGEYYTNWALTGTDGEPEEYALVAMHIMTKDIPQWFWATWVNKNVLGRCDYYGCRDDFGNDPSYTPPNSETNYPYRAGAVTLPLQAMLKAKGLDPVFRNYRLVGIQTNFVDPSGNPTLMSNTITEQNQLQTASCITCHARAAVDSSGATLSVISQTAKNETPPAGDSFATDNGIPDPSWFWDVDYGKDSDGNVLDYFTSNTTVDLTALQIDFVWGILFAKSVDNDSCTSESD